MHKIHDCLMEELCNQFSSDEHQETKDVLSRDHLTLNPLPLPFLSYLRKYIFPISCESFREKKINFHADFPHDSIRRDKICFERKIRLKLENKIREFVFD